jgi:Fuc2NAc and GlcNAc transferase
MTLSIVVLLSSIILTYSLRAYAQQRQLLDIPNERSSHSLPTPKGGGIAIVLVFIAVASYLYFFAELSTDLFLLLLCVLPVSIVSLLDDIFILSAKIRLLVQSISALFALYILGGVSSINLGLISIDGLWINIVAFISILWFTNLYNFLDGLDGYAAAEAVFVGVSVYILFQNELGLYLALASLGFLVFNWPKASLFMGDVGSAPIGFIFAILMLYDAGDSNFLTWIILLSLFWFDATITLFRRFMNKEKLSQAHKKHMYQRLNQAGWSHQKVLIASIIFNLFILILLWQTPVEYYLYLLGSILLILWGILKYVDKQKGFE